MPYKLYTTVAKTDLKGPIGMGVLSREACTGDEDQSTTTVEGHTWIFMDKYVRRHH